MMGKNKQKIIYLLMIFGTLAILTACDSEKMLQKKQAEAERIVLGNFERFRDMCEVAFPPQPIKYIPGETKIVYDTFVKEGELIDCPPPTEDNPTPKVKCPECKSLSKTIYRTDTVVVPDLIKESRYISENQSIKRDVSYWKNMFEESIVDNKKLNDENNNLYKKLTNRNYQFLMLIGIVVLFILYRIFGRRIV